MKDFHKLTDPYFLSLPAPHRFILTGAKNVWHKILASSELPFETLVNRPDLTVYELFQRAQKCPTLRALFTGLDRRAICAYIAQTRLQQNQALHIRSTDVFYRWVMGQPDPPLVRTSVFKHFHGAQYIELGQTRQSAITLQGTNGKQHSLEGAYIHTTTIDYDPGVNARCSVNGATAGSPVTHVELLLTGSPTGHSNIGDDTYYPLALFLSNDEQPFEAAMASTGTVCEWREREYLGFAVKQLYLTLETAAMAPRGSLPAAIPNPIPTSVKCGGFSRRHQLQSRAKSFPAVQTIDLPGQRQSSVA